MARKIWISSVLALAAGTFVLAPATAFAGSPLLSGYGGPGAGEQAILGSTLIGGASGGGAGGSSGSGGSGGSNLSGSVESSTSNAGGTSSTGSGSTGLSGAGGANADSGSRGTTRKGGASSHSPAGGRSTDVGSGAASAYVYATSQGSITSASPLADTSSGDLLLLVGILAALGLVAALTLRLSRLQS
ncbi:MAG TPA: hypothetical protein VHY18_06980 [Solirubrobacteraceae bacterium]|jgi:hypothetical protein|nr:hypothetical protein [Solirubrobacteraceae bacterium]